MTRCAKEEWQKMDCADIEFPELDMQYLKIIACGTYQLKQTPGYVEEHLTKDGDYQLWLNQHSSSIIHIQIHSRHKSQTKYNAWIEYDKSDKDNPIKDYYSMCPTGKRTVGMCAHIASVLYYLGYLRHTERQVKSFANNLHDAINKK